jgi:aryl-alcohol dehydrogenase-like predicted oxidoreductase
MEYRSLGRSGVKVAPLALGTMNFGNPTPEDESIRILRRAVGGGINLIDTANGYNDGESERIIGKAFQQGLNREQVVLATKFFFPTGPGPNQRGGSRMHIQRACEDSLRRLATDHIDLYQMHRPDPTTPIEETLAALTDLVRQGKVLYIGCSTFPAWKVMEALFISEMKGLARFVTEQSPYNLLDRRVENELVPLALAHGMGLLPWAPIAQGLLAGRYPANGMLPVDSRAVQKAGIYAQRISERGIAVGLKVFAFAKERGLEPVQLALTWVKDQPAVIAPLYGPRTLAQLEQALPVLEMKLSDEDRASLDLINPPGTAVVNFFNTSQWMKQVIS